MSNLGPDARKLLARGRAGEPLSPERNARLKRAVLAQVAGATVLTASATASAWGLALKGLVAVAVVGGVGFGIHALATGASTGEAKAPVAALSAAALASSASASSRVASVAPDTVASALPISESLASPRGSSSASGLNRPSLPDGQRPEPTADTVETPLVPSPSNTSAEVAPPPTASAPSAAPSAVASAAPPPSLDEEAAFLREADGALRSGNAARTLALLDEATRRFPRGSLGPERAAERIFALCALGRVADAQRESAVFLKSHAGPLGKRVAASCGGAQ
jgi:hypothetical protein